MSLRAAGVTLLALVSALATAACGSSGSDHASATATTRPMHLARTISLVGTDEVDATFAQGVAADRTGWILSGTNLLGHAGPTGTIRDRQGPVIPADWAAQGYNHVGDVDVAGATLYVPFEQSDYQRGQQAMARYDATTLQFLDATPVSQHHNSFVAVDATHHLAYSTDWFDDDAVLRYDLAHGWKRLAPLRLSRKLGHIQGGAVGGGQLFLSTDDDRNGVYGVDLRSGAVRFLGSTGHGAGEAEGIAFTDRRGRAELHTITADAMIVPVYLDHWTIVR
jgi:hypothetical protein